MFNSQVQYVINEYGGGDRACARIEVQSAHFNEESVRGEAKSAQREVKNARAFIKRAQGYDRERHQK